MRAVPSGAMSAMEVTNGNYEPMNGRPPRFCETLGAGTVAENPVDPHILDPDLGMYAGCNTIHDAVTVLESVERICVAMIKKFKAPEGPGSSQSDISQCSMDNTTVIDPLLAIKPDTEKKKRRDKFVVPVDVIDLTSEDSCDSTISRRGDQEPLAFEQVQASMATIGTTICSSPVRPLKRPQSNTPEELTILSDDEDEVQYVPYKWTSPAQRPERARGEEEDALADVWAEMARALEDAGAAQAPLPTQGKVPARGKKRKVINSAVAEHNISYDHPSIQLVAEVNELVQVESIPAPRAKRQKGPERARTDVGTSQVELRTKEKYAKVTKKTSSTAKGKEMEPSCNHVVAEAQDKAKGTELYQPGNQEFTEAQAGMLKPSHHEKTQKNQKKEKNQKGDKKGKRKGKDKEAIEDEFDEEDEEECGQPRKSTKGDGDLVEELITTISSKFNDEKVEYVPYTRRNSQDNEDASKRKKKKQDELEDAELEELFRKMEMASTLGPKKTSETCPESTGACEHRNFDFDEDMEWYYCEDCGNVNIELPMPESSKPIDSRCVHKDYEFNDEIGYFCPDCGRVLKEIQNLFLLNDVHKAVRKQVKKVQEAEDGDQQFQLTLQSSSNGKDFRVADLQLHPFYEEHLHQHQKKGFKFLAGNLFGGQQGGHEPVGCVLAHAPGTGKTFLMISFIQSFLSTFEEGRPLILAPKIMLRSWYDEFKNWEVQEIAIYGINGRIRDTAPGDGGFEEEEEDDAKLPAPTTVKETRARALQEWQAGQGGRGVLLMSYTLFALLVSNGLKENVLPESLDYQISKVLLDAPNLVILDEGHLARNDKTKISQALMAMESKRRVLLSGTLFQNNFKELYTLLKLCRDDFMISHPHYGKKVAEVAANLHGQKYNSGLSCIGKKSKKELMQIEERIFTEEIGDRLESYVKSGEVRTDEIEPVVMKLQSLTSSFVDWYPGEILKSLPGLFEYSVHLNLTSSQHQTIAHLPNEQKQHHMSRQCKLLAACIHPSLANRCEDGKGFKFPESPQLEIEACKGVKVTFILQLVALCQSFEEKLLIFCSTLTPLNYIEDLLCKKLKWQKGEQILRLDGTMQDSDRQRVIEKFNKAGSHSHVFLASTKACKEGITLVGASRVVILDNPDNPSVVRQAVSRAFRIGQKKKVFVYRLVTTNREEEEVFRRSVNKERLSQVLLDPVATMARLGGFLREQSARDIDDGLLQKMMQNDMDNGRCINIVNRYNASG